MKLIVRKHFKHSFWRKPSLGGNRYKIILRKKTWKSSKKIIVYAHIKVWREGESFQMKHAKFGEGGKEGSFVSPFYLLCRDSPPRMA